MLSLGCGFRKQYVPPPDFIDYVDISQCAFYNDYSLEQRMKIMPFRRARKIELVSFEDEILDTLIESSPFKTSRGEIPKKDKKIDRSQLIDMIQLSPVQTDSLTNILFNYDYGRARYGIYTESRSGCYSPRHALLFYRKESDKEPFAYFEVCLECREVKTFPKQYKLGSFCDGKYAMLREFFRQTGIKYGLDIH